MKKPFEKLISTATNQKFKIESVHVSFADWIDLYKTNQVCMYKNNRQGGTVSQRIVKKVKTGFDPNKFGSPVVWYDKKQNNFICFDANSRTVGIVEGLDEGLIKHPKLENEFVKVDICNLSYREMLELYQSVNNKDTHKNIDFLLNTDFWFARELKDILSNFENHKFNKDQIYNIAVVLLAQITASYKNEPLTYGQYKIANVQIKTVVSHINKPSSDIWNNMDKHKANVINALKEYLSLIYTLKTTCTTYIRNHGASMRDDTKKRFKASEQYLVHRSSALLAFVLIDALGENKLVKLSKKDLTVNIASNMSKYHELVANYHKGGDIHEDLVNLVTGKKKHVGRENKKIRKMLETT